MNSLIEPLKSSHKLILLGDYNIDLLKNNNHKYNFELCLQSNYLVPTIFSATRVASKTHNNEVITTETLIDNIFINHNMNYQSGIIETSISDHFSIYIAIPEISASPDTVLNSIQYRVNNDIRKRKFNHDLIRYDIKQVLNNNIAKSAYEQFNNIFESSYDEAFPIKTKVITPLDLQKPWVNDILKRRIKIRENLNTLSRKKKINRKVFAVFRNRVTSQLRSAKAKYFEEQFERCSDNIKKTWEVINSVIKSKKVNSKIILSDDDGNHCDESKIPSEFIQHYASVPQQLASKIPTSEKNASSYLSDRVKQSFFMSPITPEEINLIIADLNDNGNKVHSIAISVLESCKHIISPILSHLINLFVEQGYFPDDLKVGCITPIFKKGDKEKVNNYRPVCSLSPLSKIIEKAINNRMVEYLEKFKLLSETQYGFRKNMGTENALLNYIDLIQQGLNGKQYTISVFLDLSKAFDLIDHKILARKLEYYGFRGKFLEFLLSFIKDQKYFVNVNGKNSETKLVNIGVPQGSTLGPLLFLLYINDMRLCSTELELTQFADDSTITYSSENLPEAVKTTETEFKKVLDWLAANKLIINLEKTHLMLFTNKAHQGNVSINANGHTINEITEIKFLGVMLDNKLSWKAHIKYISSKISKSVSILKMLKFFFPSRILKSLYYSFVYPYFSYCNIIWGGAANTHLESLVLLQKKCIRIICKMGYLDHTEPLFKENNILKIDQIYSLNCAKFVFCSLNKIKYIEFHHRLATNGSFHHYQTRSSKQLRTEYVRLQKFMNSFLNHGIKIWNDLPESIKNVKSLPTFKRKTKEYILNKCKLCQMKEIGDDYHYLFICTFFKNPRRKYINKYYYSQPNRNKMAQLYKSHNYIELLNLDRFKNLISKDINAVT